MFHITANRTQYCYCVPKGREDSIGKNNLIVKDIVPGWTISWIAQTVPATRSTILLLALLQNSRQIFLCATQRVIEIVERLSINTALLLDWPG